MEAAFWDSSTVVPTLVKQKASIRAKELTKKYAMIVSWFAPVEVRSSIARLSRTAQITGYEQVQAIVLLDELRAGWREIAPGPAMRQKAEDFVDRFPLRAGDALQLASAWAWCQGHPSGRPFISSDAQLLDAARQLGFNVIQA
jgi:predicted nucleic acid-binding protein